MSEMRCCPDCGAPLSHEQTREIGRMRYRWETMLMSPLQPGENCDDPIGRKIGPWSTRVWCNECQYEEMNGVRAASADAR